MSKRFEMIKCADGFTMSVQAHKGAYCSPRSGVGPFTAVEVGFPNEPEELLMEFAESPSTPTDSIYGWVPAKVILEVVTKHGGMIGGELPSLKLGGE